MSENGTGQSRQATDGREEVGAVSSKHIPEELEDRVTAVDGDLVVKETKDGREVTDLQTRLEKKGIEVTKRTVSREKFDELSPDDEQSVEQAEALRQAGQIFDRAMTHFNATDIFLQTRGDDGRLWYESDGSLKGHDERDAAVIEKIVRGMFNSEMVKDTSTSFNANQSMKGAIPNNEKWLPRDVESARLQMAPSAGGFTCVIRLFHDQDFEATDLSDLGFLKQQRFIIDQMSRRQDGIRFFTGPTGSGKNTSMVTKTRKVHLRNDCTEHLMTIEDPIEIQLELDGVTQLHADAEGAEDPYAQRLNEALRMSPDVIVISEIRSEQSAEGALKAANTGHQVWTTLHTNNAVETISRLDSLGISAYMLTNPSIIQGLVSQRLVPRLCTNCREPFVADGSYETEQLQPIADWVRSVLDRQVWQRHSEGCSNCTNGISGRALIAETIDPDERLLQHLYNRERGEAIQYWLDELDGYPLARHGIRRAFEGACSIRDIESVLGTNFFTEFDRIKVAYEDGNGIDWGEY